MQETNTAQMAPGLRRRMACWLYEGLLLFGVVFISGYLFSTLTQTRHALDNRHAMQFFLFGVLGVYFTWFGHKGQTLAMKTWRIRLVGPDGQSVSYPRAFARFLLSWVWFLPPLAALAPFELSGSEVLLLCGGWVLVWAIASRFQREQQFWHDIWAGTRLVHHDPLAKVEAEAE